MIRRLVWFLVGFAAVSLPMFAFAEDYPASYRWRENTTGWFQYDHTWAEVNAQLDANAGDFVWCQNAPEPVYPQTVTVAHWRYSWQPTCPGANEEFNISVSWALSCPGGGTLSGTTCLGAPPCPAGQQRNSAGQCVVPPCPAGTSYSSGYYDYGLQPDSTMVAFGCANGCEVTFVGDVPAARQLVGGVYHYFAKGSYDRTGATCTSGPSVTANTPAVPAPTCGANQGSATMNGKTVCVDNTTGTESNPYAPKPPPETTENKTTATNPDGSTTTVTETCTGPNSCTTTTQTCTGPGSCTSTTTNTGGGSGGGSGTGSGPGKDVDGDGQPDYDADGNPVDPEKDAQDQCQKTPNASMCQEKVKIDPEDSPTEADYTQKNREFDDAWAEVKANVEGQSWKWTSLGFVWNPSIPSGSCSSVQVGNQLMDICPALEKARALWAWVIGVTASLAIWITGTRAISGAKL